MTLALQALAEPGRAAAAASCMGLSEATVSRIKNERLQEVALLCAHLGIKWVPADHMCVARETYEFLTRSHQRVMQSNPELIWEADET